MKRKLYEAKSLSGAQAFVRSLIRRQEKDRALLEEFNRDRLMFAKLAADGPAFYNPLEVFAAKKRRDEILKSWCNLNPDGTPVAR